MTTAEGSLKLEDGTELYTKTWTPEEVPRAILVFIHGFSDHCNTHETFFATLVSRGIEVRSLDQRGWGQSVKRATDRGSTGPTSLVLADITSLLQSIPHSSAPIFLMGHSMGGAEILCYALLPSSSAPPIRSRVRGYIAEAPWIALHPESQPNGFTIFAGRLAGKLLPKRQLIQKLDKQWISRDQDVGNRWELDPLCHNTGTLEGLAGALERAAELDKWQNPAITEAGVGLLLAHGSEDHVTSFDASRRFMGRVEVAGGKEFREYEGWYHKLHAEPGEDKITFSNMVADWILARSGDEDAGSNGKAKL